MCEEKREVTVQHLYLAAINTFSIYERAKTIRELYKTEDYTEKWLNKQFYSVAKQICFLDKHKIDADADFLAQLADKLKHYYMEVYQN